MAQKTNYIDVLNAAIQKEKNAVDFYQKALEIVKYPGSSEMLLDFITEERKHVSLLEEAKRSRVFKNVSSTEFPPDIPLTQLLMDENISEMSTPQDVMLAAIKNEDNAVLLYAQKARVFHGTDLESVFINLMQMEKKHKKFLEDEYEKHFMPDN